MTNLARVSGIKQAVIGSLILGAVSTLGDFIWAMWISQHRMVAGLLHGAILCLCLGLVLGLFVGTRRAMTLGALLEMGVGVIAAGSFYLFYSFAGMAAMFISWMLLWMLTALLNAKITGTLETRREPLMRGAIAAVLSGLAFYAISGIWLDPNPGGPTYWYNLIAWTFAFFPGFLALLLRRADEPTGVE